MNSISSIGLPVDKYEIICINDCSPDGTKAIIVEYQKNQPNLILIDHTVNKKQGGARNTGLRIARGKYCWFVDPDDFIKIDKLSELINLCENSNLDILQFNYEKVSEDSKFLFFQKNVIDSEVLSGIEFANIILGNSFLNNYNLSVCSRLYRTNFLRDNSIFFIENTILEDLEFSLRSLLFSERIQSVSDSFYYYRDNPNSTMNALANDRKGSLIFQVTVIIGKGLIDLSKDLEKDLEKSDPTIRNQLLESGISRINLFTKPLIKMSIVEQNSFYLQLKNHKEIIESLLPFFNSKNRFILKHRFFSKLAFSPVYPIIQMLLHKKKR